MAGEVHTRLKCRSLAARLRASGIPAEARESSLYEGGWYLRISGDCHITMERIGPDEFLVVADADDPGLMRAAAARLSGALTTLGFRHRFELYDGESRMAHYLHHL